MQYKRVLSLRDSVVKKSVLLLGPRRTGKSWLLRNELPPHTALNLLHSETFARLTQKPGFLRELATSQTTLISIDEIQRLPWLMNEVHALIEERPSLRFVLTGSSARKLRSQHTSLMAGRARTHHLHPLVTPELAEHNWPLEKRLLFGSLPAVVSSDDPFEELKDYAGDYLREEIAAEGYARNLEAFSRFLTVAATCQGCEVNFEKVASDCQVPARTVREYFHILEDTLVGSLVRPFSGTTKRKPVSRSKFYLFDVGVHNALVGLSSLPLADTKLGTQMESVVFQELQARLSYARDERPLTYWRTQGGAHEVDFLLGDEIAIEVKATRAPTQADLKGLRALSEERNFRRKILVSRDPLQREAQDGIEFLSFETFVSELWEGKI
jgi:predicted AAA+ superfamily ATPase